MNLKITYLKFQQHLLGWGWGVGVGGWGVGVGGWGGGGGGGVMSQLHVESGNYQ